MVPTWLFRLGHFSLFSFSDFVIFFQCFIFFSPFLKYVFTYALRARLSEPGFVLFCCNEFSFISFLVQIVLHTADLDGVALQCFCLFILFKSIYLFISSSKRVDTKESPIYFTHSLCFITISKDIRLYFFIGQYLHWYILSLYWNLLRIDV